MGPAGFEPATERLCIPLQLSLPLSGLWAGLSLHPRPGCLPFSLYTFLITEAWLGITTSCDSGFPEFGRCHQKIALRAALCRDSYLAYNPVMLEELNCIMCGVSLHGRQTRFCSVACKNDHHQSYEAQKRRGLARKLELVSAKGGCCSICGYRKNLSALAFHHLDSAEKDFKLDMRSLSNRKFQPVLGELDKCILVCHNCHAELHNPLLDLDSLL